MKEAALTESVRGVVRTAIEKLLTESPQFREDRVPPKWLRGEDGHFREATGSGGRVSIFVADEWVESLPGYDQCLSQLSSDPEIGSHLNELVGTNIGRSRIEPQSIIKSLIYEMIRTDHTIQFDDERFDHKWGEIVESLRMTVVQFRTVAPLPYLRLPQFPLVLAQGVTLDRLTDEEVSRCFQVGVLQPRSHTFPVIGDEVAVGIRAVFALDKQVGADNSTTADFGEGTFGKRPILRSDLLIEDVLSVLRLTSGGLVRCAGQATWTDWPWLAGGTTFRVQSSGPAVGSLALSVEDADALIHVWALLAQAPDNLRFSLRRFNFAFDRGMLLDKIVDLVIAAESLLLADQRDEKYRGEIRFRFALRAAKFVSLPSYTERDVFRLMRQAYDVRSSIVHGGRPPEKLKLPDKSTATLDEVTAVVEVWLRTAIRRALEMIDDNPNIANSDFWEAMLFDA